MIPAGPRRRSPLFAILFIAALLAASALVFVGFSSYQRMSASFRQQLSHTHLEKFHAALDVFAQAHHGEFPSQAGELTGMCDAETRVNPAWPDEPGYVYIPGALPSDPAAATILIHENVPERKRKLGTQLLFLDGSIRKIEEARVAELLAAQKARWTSSGRVWGPVLIPSE